MDPDEKPQNPTDNNNLINELYLKFNKKIKKNTLKLIFDLQKDISNLKKNRDQLEIIK